MLAVAFVHGIEPAEHPTHVQLSPEQDRGPPERELAAHQGSPASVDEIYQEHCDFVWRSLRRLGVPEAALADATQEVFLAVLRHWTSFEGRAALRTWLFAIARGVARDLRRAQQRRGNECSDELLVDGQPWPAREVENREAARLVCQLLDRLDEPKRAVFVLAELEQLSLPEAAEILGVNLNTAYSRLRAARREFEAALTRHRARERVAARTE